MIAPKHRCDTWRVAEACGVRLMRPEQSRQQRRPRECFAKRTLKRIGQRHGEAHLALVLRLIVETDGNAAELGRDTIVAISGLLAANPALLDRGGALFDDFDRIDLMAVRLKAKELSVGLSTAETMRVLLALEMIGADK
ncbi:MAG: hypothetical protein K5872_22180 [Rhizobiaceae bacterium]|nr:hypothetical protein [Rhizobiaceae bacterium]MCV0408929.1 hypothetical protein [Rhizobiaceae bacterium]